MVCTGKYPPHIRHLLHSLTLENTNHYKQNNRTTEQHTLLTEQSPGLGLRVCYILYRVCFNILNLVHAG